LFILLRDYKIFFGVPQNIFIAQSGPWCKKGWKTLA